MKKIYIWGAGYYSRLVYSVIDKTSCIVRGFIDNDKRKQGTLWDGSLMIYGPNILKTVEFDHIFISPVDYRGIEQACLDMGIPKEKLVIYWKDPESEGLFKNRGLTLIDVVKYKYRLENAPYEWGLKPIPSIRSGEELLNKILREKSSLCRFGDGEFEIMRGQERPWFQNVEKNLSKRLCGIIRSRKPSIIITIPANFGSLSMYKEESADDIRAYMVDGTRDSIMRYIDPDGVYYDAYVSRPYIIYKDRMVADKIFLLFKAIWEGRDVILVEGRYTRNGMGNDLFAGVRSVKRILCPIANAWDVYDQILSSVLDIAGEKDLICISLGPTATVMAYDLGEKGYQALDIGQLDNEYEWYIRGTQERMLIPGKMVAEIKEHHVEKNLYDEEYKAQICKIVGGAGETL